MHCAHVEKAWFELGNIKHASFLVLHIFCKSPQRLTLSVNERAEHRKFEHLDLLSALCYFLEKKKNMQLEDLESHSCSASGWSTKINGKISFR